jgi:hypothetical protein
MATKGRRNYGTERAADVQRDVLPDDFPAELVGEFRDLPAQFWQNFGTICGRVLASGGYVGLSITDDGGSAKLAVRCALVSFEKRVYKFVDMERLTAYLLGKTTK